MKLSIQDDVIFTEEGGFQFRFFDDSNDDLTFNASISGIWKGANVFTVWRFTESKWRRLHAGVEHFYDSSLKELDEACLELLNYALHLYPELPILAKSIYLLERTWESECKMREAMHLYQDSIRQAKEARKDYRECVYGLADVRLIGLLYDLFAIRES